jgi:hypothetical protein
MKTVAMTKHVGPCGASNPDDAGAMLLYSGIRACLVHGRRTLA